jgi:hypothetical protein
MIGAAPQVLAWIALMAVEGKHAATGSAVDSPTLQLSSSYFQGSGALPANRNALALVLTAQSHLEPESFAYGASLGWIRLYQPGDGSGLATMHVGNPLAWASYRSAFTSRLNGDLGLGLSLGLTASDRSPRRRLLRNALSHGLAMQGLYDAWVWAPGRGGFVLPARLQHQHALGRWAGSARLEGAFLLTLPDSEEGDQALGRVLQAGAEYAVLPRPWLAVGGRLQFVWMPVARLWKTQWSAVPFLAVVRGRWRVAADVLLNIDEPFGFAGNGQRIWAASLKVGAWL